MTAEQIIVNKIVEINDSIKAIDIAMQVPILNILALVISTLTLFFLIWTTLETHRIANQTVESALRPLLLRTGQIVNWQIVSKQEIDHLRLIPESTLRFTNEKNIGTDIEGEVILDRKKYKLLFYGDVPGSILNGVSIVLNERWTWLPEKSFILATFDENIFEVCNEMNQIYLSYKDIEGNKYFTKEDNLHSVTSKRI